MQSTFPLGYTICEFSLAVLPRYDRNDRNTTGELHICEYNKLFKIIVQLNNVVQTKHANT